MGNVRNQLERAAIAYLIAQNAGTAADTFPGRSVQVKTYPCTVVRAFRSDHDPVFSGSEMVQLQIQIKGSAANAANAANPANVWVAFDARVAAVQAALMTAAVLSDGSVQDLSYVAQQITVAGRALATSNPQNNADMAAFTCQSWYYKGATCGEPAEGDCAWVEILNFEARVASVALS
jgi:hypothetical protein